MKSICILGLGYIGLPTASIFATHGLKVIGVDTNLEIVNGLNSGKIHLYEPGLLELVQDALQTGNLVVCPEPELADAFLIAVPTPFKEGKKADMDFVISAAESIVPHLQKGNLVILESTSPPRTTTDLVATILETSGLKAGIDFYLVYSPERVLPGKILYELINNDRVIGGINPASSVACQDLYNIFVKGKIFLTDATTAEMVKLMENTYRDINIAAANEFARLADKFQVDIWEAISLANRHPRVKILNPGIGVGGHCISVDPWFFIEAAPKLTDLIHTARNVNDSQPLYVLDFLESKYGKVTGKKIAALGLAYKPDVDDLRESPAIEFVKLLRDKGAKMRVYEPFNINFEIKGIENAQTLKEAVADAEIILLLVGHTQFNKVIASELASITKAKTVLDTVNGWERSEWESAGFSFLRLGDGNH